ncbi:hypothetical protein [Kineothrix sp. MB12-C1]|uniref:hypothetical protein n=1 Tax=Kineothrix sp. MB12-C1 TaxID=3070215 RepID=UPI0027D2E8C7|nr:hypothetical protein [Kineothrix sp. MB12-C1]WMC91320.1 hypothetical protein RBB56_10540 [Kineothrix sp. MB12-C1]
MLTIEEKLIKADEQIKKLKQQQILDERRKKEAKRKKDQRRNYIIGELVTKFFPEVLYFEPGNKADNVTIFLPLETFLQILSVDQELMSQLKQKVIDKLPAENRTSSL